MKNFYETVQWLRERCPEVPEFGIILGTGLGNMVSETEVLVSFDYKDIPHFPIATAESHAGKLHFVRWQGKICVILQGRFHHYEGYTMQQVTYPVRILKLLGIHTLLISNISGALNPDLKLADLVAMEDHINLHYENPLTGPNLDEFGPRWPDMHGAYDPELLQTALEFARKEEIPMKRGIYVSVPGPNLETPAEYRYLARTGADCVGMSTVPEVIVARHMGLRVFAISAISDIAYGKIKPADIDSLLAAAAKAQPLMTAVFRHIVKGDA